MLIKLVQMISSKHVSENLQRAEALINEAVVDDPIAKHLNRVRGVSIRCQFFVDPIFSFETNGTFAFVQHLEGASGI